MVNVILVTVSVPMTAVTITTTDIEATTAITQAFWFIFDWVEKPCVDNESRICCKQLQRLKFESAKERGRFIFPDCIFNSENWERRKLPALTTRYAAMVTQ